MHPLLRRLLSPAGFLLVACCFLLPFVTTSCTPAPKSTMSATYNGADLIAGSRAEVSVTDGFQRLYGPIAEASFGSASTTAIAERETQPIGWQPLMAAALALVMCGIVLSGLTAPWPRALAATGTALTAAIVLAGAELIAMHAARTRLTVDARPVIGGTSAHGSLTIPPSIHAAIQARYGFWLALLLLVVLAAGNGTALYRLSGRQSPQPRPAVAPGTLRPPPEVDLR